MGLLAIVTLLLLVVHLPTAYTSPVELPAQGSKARRELAPGQLGAVASERFFFSKFFAPCIDLANGLNSDICSRQGTEILKKGGNAADAVCILAARTQNRLVD